MDNIQPIASEILSITAQMAPLEARLEILKTQLRDAAQPGTIVVPGVGKVTLTAGSAGTTKTELALDAAKFDESADEVRSWLLENAIVISKVTTTPARKSSVKPVLNA